MKKIFILFFVSFVFFAVPLSANAKVKIITRQQWGADEEIIFRKLGIDPPPLSKETDHEGESKSDVPEADPEIERVETHSKDFREYLWPLQYAKEIKFIVIHYTGLTNELPDNPMQEMRNIFRSHTISRGWGDIGYHFLIDRQGNVYEGRKGGAKVIGGHATPVNKVSIGISLMGNYEEEELPAPMLEATIELLNDLTKQYRLDPLGKTEYKGKTYDVIHGHKDNTPKLDPGKYFDQKMQKIRNLLAYRQSKKKKTKDEKYNFTPVSERELIAAPPDQEKEFIVRVKNSGTVTWRKNTYLENIDEPTLPRLIAKLENEKVPPGGLGIFRGNLPKTLVSGMRLPSLSLVVNGMVHPKKSFPVPIMVTGLKTTYDIIGRSDPPETLKKNESYKAWIILKNTGNFTWQRSGKNPVVMVEIGKGGAVLARLKEKSVKPGETGKFVFRGKAAGTPGTVNLRFQPTVTGVSAIGKTPLRFVFSVQEVVPCGHVNCLALASLAPRVEKPLRVALSFHGKKPKIRSAAGMQLFEENRLVGEFGKNETARIARLKKGGYRVAAGEKKIDLISPPRFQSLENGILEIVNFENRPAWNLDLNDNLFRGVLEIQKIDGTLRVINELPLEDYLKGIAEISNSDPKEKIKTIIILARSYAKYYRDVARKFPGKPYDLDDDPDHTQKYAGYGLELRSPNITSAVLETAGKIVTFQGKQVITPYFNQSDGRTRSAEEVWGWRDTPYLQSVPDSFCGSSTLKGHGVGLSGCGATALAQQGKSADEIIKYYYQGVDITGQK